jgi:hypothetical protein
LPRPFGAFPKTIQMPSWLPISAGSSSRPSSTLHAKAKGTRTRQLTDGYVQSLLYDGDEEHIKGNQSSRSATSPVFQKV